MAWSKIVGFVLMAVSLIVLFADQNWVGAAFLGAFGLAIFIWGW